MNLHRVMFVLAFALAGCSSSGSSTDARPSDGSKPLDSPAPDAPRPDAAAATCTGLPYDSCNPAANNCMNGMQCHTFSGAGFSVCTPSCAGPVACPDQNGTAVSCNNMSLCKPPAPNSDCSAP